MSGRGTSRESVARFTLAVAGHLGWRPGTHTTTKRVHRDIRPQNTTVSVPERVLQIKIKIAPPRRNCIVVANRAIDLPHSFVVLVRELRICEILAFPRLSVTFTSTQHPTITHVRELGQA